MDDFDFAEYEAESTTPTEATTELQDIMSINHTHPLPSADDFQKKIYEKREYYYHKMPEKEKLNTYEDIENFRDVACGKGTGLLEQQSFLANFINPDTPYKGVLVFHGTGTGKTCAGIAIAEKFKPLIQKYKTKIYILVNGPLNKDNWKQEFLNCTGEEYLKKQDIDVYQSDADREKAKKNAISIILQYYRFMSYRSFYKKVLGEKVVEKITTEEGKVKNVARKTEEGEYERDIAIDRLYNLNNSLIIVDEAHSLTGNAYGDALTKIIKHSTNLKVVLLTATPMKNLADDIVELINFIRPQNDLIERDRVFTSNKNYLMDFKPGGQDYLKKMIRGYVSYLRGVDPLVFAKRIDKGKIPKGLLFTNMTPCYMRPFQHKIYDETTQIADDALDRNSTAVANFAFPALSEDKKTLIGVHGRDGIILLRNQLKTYHELLNKKIALEILKDDSLQNDSDLIYMNETTKTIAGKILQQKYLKHFSIKFYRVLKKLNRLVYQKKGARTAFVYSNLVKVGIEMFREVLLANGYLEYDENPDNYKYEPTTRCYLCGLNYENHIDDTVTSSEERPKGVSDSSSEYKKKDIPAHEFYPATFISITGQSNEEAADVIPEEKIRILYNVFSHIDNLNGKYIKIILGSRVMNEGISLKNVAEVHILDVYYNLGRVDQVIGRAIRHCSHYKLMNKENPYPEVSVYKYAVALKNGKLSSEEELYQKAEIKYLLVKKVERILKANAIDCPINRNANLFPHEIEENRGCKTPDKVQPGDKMCPMLCDYMDCEYKCEDKALNKAYFEQDKQKYRKLKKNQLDYSTFTHDLASSEVDSIKEKIKNLYRVSYVYTLNHIVNYVRNSYEGEKRELFDEFFVFRALDELIPVSENDFNNFKDTIYDKYNRMGYLIHIDEYYIFQPFDQNEDVPMYYRSTFDKPMKSKLTLYNYIKNTIKDTTKKADEKIYTDEIKRDYDFDSVMEYYDNRKEFKYVGIIDRESGRRRVREDVSDVFKIRDKRGQILDKKRGTGIPSLKGAVCHTSKSMGELDQICMDIDIPVIEDGTRLAICQNIKERLLHLEKYSTNKKKNKLTYVMIPKNHPKYPFPYNLEDRKDYLLDEINSIIKFKINVNVKEVKTKVQKEEVTTYVIEINHIPALNDFEKQLHKMGAQLKDKKWTIKVE